MAGGAREESGRPVPGAYPGAQGFSIHCWSPTLLNAPANGPKQCDTGRFGVLNNMLLRAVRRGDPCRGLDAPRPSAEGSRCSSRVLKVEGDVAADHSDVRRRRVPCIVVKTPAGISSPARVRGTQITFRSFGISSRTAVRRPRGGPLCRFQLPEGRGGSAFESVVDERSGWQLTSTWSEWARQYRASAGLGITVLGDPTTVSGVITERKRMLELARELDIMSSVDEGTTSFAEDVDEESVAADSDEDASSSDE